MLARVQIQHQLRDRAMQTRDRALQHDEASTRKFRGGIEIDEPELLAERNVIERLERELRRIAPPSYLDVRRGVRAFGNRLVQYVWQPGEKIVELDCQRRQSRFARAELFAKRTDLALQRLDVAARSFRAAVEAAPREIGGYGIEILAQRLRV